MKNGKNALKSASEGSELKGIHSSERERERERGEMMVVNTKGD